MPETNEPDAPIDVIVFEDGIPGFPRLNRFVLIDVVEDGVFQELRSIDDPGLSLIVCVPWVFFPDYAPELLPEEQQDLEINTPEEAVVFCGVSLDAASGNAFVNLLGPFVVNPRTLRGRQIVLSESDYPPRARIDLERV